MTSAIGTKNDRRVTLSGSYTPPPLCLNGRRCLAWTNTIEQCSLPKDEQRWATLHMNLNTIDSET